VKKSKAAKLWIHSPDVERAISRTYLRLNTETRTAGQEPIVRIFGVQFGRHSGGLAIRAELTISRWMCFKLHGSTCGAASIAHSQSPILFRRTVGSTKLAREPVLKAPVRRRFALHPEILDVLTRPIPKYACQRRLTSTRAVVGERLFT
jgi:hypothetical protein